MSRFFRSVSDSESDSESSDNESFISDEELSSEAEESDEEEQAQEEQPKKSRFLKGAESDSDEESDEEFGRKRQVKSALDKRLDEMNSSLKAIENGQKNNDWNLISSEFDKLTASVNKATSGFDAIPTPKFYIKTIVEIENMLQEAPKEKAGGKKKGAASKGLTNVKQKMRKITKQYEQQIAEYKKDPEAFMAEKEEKPESPTPKDSKPKAATATATVDESELDGFTSVGKGGKTIVPITADNIFVKLREVMESRGKKNTDRDEQITTLERLLEAAESSFQKILVLLALIPSRFDVNLSMAEHMQVDVWKKVETEVNLLLSILEKETSFVVREDADELDHDDKDIVPEKGQTIYIRGSIISLVERLDDEFTKSLQSIDPHTTDYIDRLRDEPALYAVLVRAQAYIETNNMLGNLPRIIIRRLEHLYYKPNQVIQSTEKISKSLLPDYIKSNVITVEEPSQLVHQLCTYLYKQNMSVLRTRAMLCHIYHYALHKHFHTARDMLLMSHLQESIHQADISTQILYNRTVVQIGLCAFRDGLIKEAHACLQEIQGSGRVKELLAQGVQAQRYGQQTTPELEQLERQRQLPFHMHINLELLECVFLTCSMLLEIPAQAQAGPNNKRTISRPFRRLLDYNERQAFAGPPENTRDHIMSAAKALASGEWERARDYILAIKIWNLMPETQEIKDMLVHKIQEEGLRTYLFTYASYYSTLGLAQLANMFDLPVARVSAIVAKLIWNEELSASLDQVSQAVVLHRVEPSRLQVLSLQFAEKAANLVDQNERLLTTGRDRQ
ncbi:eukaryotic translation initiation factor 3 subunit 8 N-terminus-domain-containing protein [Zychaea mexicana]|uniref:eukaryotic translation initiation factor 3 subunit 8 N-terminus-domain-containing protein n=1 Tax=Zychaea mexicana TaxID=64656 RepID=UPI0022FEE2D3|nr:eukaryotic translation initiation factor 3 subunit 8 N-terminus-domain-containing protein [Zychaea mexicana]KAI9492156.1 eukaryotic translation initiation factor 3 subunit 8 N-terminus-domain-containing protein [Zychaea mexicana]